MADTKDMSNEVFASFLRTKRGDHASKRAEILRRGLLQALTTQAEHLERQMQHFQIPGHRVDTKGTRVVHLIEEMDTWNWMLETSDRPPMPILTVKLLELTELFLQQRSKSLREKTIELLNNFHIFFRSATHTFKWIEVVANADTDDLAEDARLHSVVVETLRQCRIRQEQQPAGIRTWRTDESGPFVEIGFRATPNIQQSFAVLSSFAFPVTIR